MDGPWQIGQLQAREYGRKARDAAKQMRVIDPDLRLIACGSSGTFMPTYLVWDREVLEECYDQVDGISLHAYYGNTKEWSGNSTARFLAMNLDMDRHIHEIAAVCDYVQGLQRSSKRLWLSFDEWNVWYRARDAQSTDGRRAAAPRLLEEVYNLEDALLVGGFVNTLLRNSDRVRLACLAQLVNVIAPLVTNETGVLRQSTYYPYNWALRYARGRVLDLRVESDTYRITADGLQADFARDATVPFVDLVATIDDTAGQAAVLVLNRDLDGEREVVLEWEDVVPTRVLACETMTGADLKAVNTFAEPRRVAPQRLDPPAAGSRMTFKLPPRSYTVAHLAGQGVAQGTCNGPTVASARCRRYDWPASHDHLQGRRPQSEGRGGHMTDLKLLARRAMGMALGLVVVGVLCEPALGQVKTTVPHVVAGARPARMERITIHGHAHEPRGRPLPRERDAVLRQDTVVRTGETVTR